MIYLINYVIIAALGILSNKYALRYGKWKIDNTKQKTVFLLFSVLLLIFVAALRSDEVGNDTPAYIGIFEMFNDGSSVRQVQSFASTIENGYIWFVKGINLVSNNRIVFLLAHAIIIYGVIFKYVQKHSENIILSILMFVALFYTSTLNLMRQYLAISVMLCALQCIHQKKYKMAFCLCIIGISLHTASILFIPILVLAHIKNKKDLMLIFELGVLIVGVLVKQTDIVNRVLVFLGYGRYINSSHLTGADSGGLMSIIYLIIVVLGIIVWFFKKEFIDEEYCLYLMSSSVGALFSLLASDNAMFARAATSYIIFIILLFPMVLKRILSETKSNKVIMISVYVMLFIATYISGRNYSYSMTELL